MRERETREMEGMMAQKLASKSIYRNFSAATVTATVPTLLQ